MTRIENDSDPVTGVDPAELRSAIKEEARKLRPQKQIIRKRPLFGCFNCLVLALIVMAFLLAGVLSAVAKSGVLTVPLFSDWLYTEPQPLHPVAATNTDLDALQRDVLRTLAQTQSTTVVFYETELTALLQQALTAAEQSQVPLTITDGQIAIASDRAEVWLRVSRPVAGVLTMAFVPRIQNQQLFLEVKELKLGQLSLPRGWGQILVNATINKTLGRALTDAPVVLRDARLTDGQLLIDFSLKAE
ncbi:hypothetical protein HY933_03750 [Candidatus Falkowbacteria bacterium]|nr:hypothetical protein [Candidatus Falkowbacteria bacterium]